MTKDYGVLVEPDLDDDPETNKLKIAEMGPSNDVRQLVLFMDLFGRSF